MPEDITDLEHRLDQVEAWQKSRDAVDKVRSEADTRRHTNLQILFSVVSSMTMVVNLYLTVNHGK